MKEQNEYHYHQAISLTFEQKTMLEDICQKTKMTKSEVVQELIKKAYSDKKTRDIIQWNFASTLETKRQLRIMSSESTEKNEPSHHSDDSTAVSNSDLFEFNTKTNENQEFQRKLDLQKNAQEFANLTCQILSAEQLNAVAYENWNFWTIGELMKIADENIRRQKR